MGTKWPKIYWVVGSDATFVLRVFLFVSWGHSLASAEFPVVRRGVVFKCPARAYLRITAVLDGVTAVDDERQ